MSKECNQGLYLIVVAVTAISLTVLVMFPFTQGTIQGME